MTCVVCLSFSRDWVNNMSSARSAGLNSKLKGCWVEKKKSRRPYMRKMLPHCVWCLCVFFVSCDKRGSRSISKQYTYNKQQREAEKEGGESLEENSNSRSCDSSADSLAFPFSAQDSLFCLPLSRFIGGHCSHFTPKPQFSAPSESFFNPTPTPVMCVTSACSGCFSKWHTPCCLWSQIAPVPRPFCFAPLSSI